MEKFTELMSEINIVSTAVRLILAMLLGGIIGFDRERRGRAAGFRTHILVCIGACMASLAGIFAVTNLGLDADATRIAAQVISGIGFLGVGTILITGNKQVLGLTTAAGLWATASVGICLGFGFYSGAIIGTALLVFVMVFLHKLDSLFSAKTSNLDIYLELDDVKKVNEFIDKIKDLGLEYKEIDVCNSKSNTANAIGMEMTLKNIKEERKPQITETVKSVPGVIFVIRKD